MSRTSEIWENRLLGGTLMLGWIAAVLFFQYLASVAKAEYNVGAVLFFHGLQVLVSFFLPGQAVKAMRRARGLAMPTAEQLLTADRRPPVVFLRSFQDDGSAKDPPVIQLLQPLLNPVGGASMPHVASFEQEIAAALDSIGPMIALSKQDSQVEEPGVARFAPVQEWEEEVTARLKGCGMVVIRGGETKGLLWEIERVVELVDPERVIIYLQFGTEQDDGVQQARYNRFRRTVAHVFPKPLPERIEKNRVLHFRPGWEPQLSRTIVRALRAKGVPFEKPLRNSLRKLFPFARWGTALLKRTSWARKGAPPIGRLGRASRMAGLLACAAVLGCALGCVYGTLLFWNPVPYAGVLLFGAFTYLTGALAGLGGVYLTVAGSVSYVVAGGVAALSFLYGEWAAYFSWHRGTLVLSPAEIDELSSNVIWAVEESEPASAGALDALWTWEALLAIGIIVLVCWVFGLSKFSYMTCRGASIHPAPST